jgi:drug/metabolite transporter (DMT)-like permease
LVSSQTIAAGNLFDESGIIFLNSAQNFFSLLDPEPGPQLISERGQHCLLYLGSGVGLAIWSWFSGSKGRLREAQLTGSDFYWLAGAIVTGGIIGPVLLMVGLAVTPASSTSLLLNLEGVFTALFAWSVFKENFERQLITLI